MLLIVLTRIGFDSLRKVFNTLDVRPTTLTMRSGETNYFLYHTNIADFLVYLLFFSLVRAVVFDEMGPF